MNYFELFDLPDKLPVDKSLLNQRYVALQRQYHPDFFAQAADSEKAAALERSAEVNKAYKTLQQPEAVLGYVLMLKGVLEEEEKYALPPDFLMDMMELNEALEEGTADVTGLGTQVAAVDAALDTTIQPVLAAYPDAGAAGLEQMKTYYFKKKYLSRIKERIRNIAAQ